MFNKRRNAILALIFTIFMFVPFLYAGSTSFDLVISAGTPQIGSGDYTTTGNVFFVDSGHAQRRDASDHGAYDKPFATLDYAIGRATASNGDIIFVAPGHAESYTVANGFDADVAGIRIVGLGEGANRPTFNFADTDATVAIGAANVTIENLRFVAGISNIVVGISVEAGGDNFTLRNCEVPESGTATFDFATFIDLASGADDVTIDGMIFRQLATTPGDLDHFLKSGTGVNKNLTIKNSDIRGEFLVSAIWSNQIDTNVLIDNCIIVNATNGQHAIEFTTTAAGLIRNTAVATDAQATAVDPGSLDLVNVKWNSDTTADAAGIDVIATALGASGPDSIGDINATTTDSIHGKIGTDTEMADSSLYDMLGPNTAATTDSINGKLGTDAEFNDNSIYDMLGAGAKTLAISTAIGTLDQATTDSLHGKIGTDTEMADSSLYDMIMTLPKSVEKSDGTVLDTGEGDAIFVVAGGPVRAKIVGIVTTVVGGAANLQVKHTTTEPAATTNLSTNVAIDTDAAGTSYIFIGAAGVLTPVTNGVQLVDPVTVEETEYILPIGTVSADASAAQTGAIKWYITYTPLSPLSRVTAAP